MGGFRWKDTRKLVVFIGTVFTISLLVACQVSAESVKTDSDLVFENLEQTDIKHHDHRISEEDSSRQNEDEHWFSGTVNRIKRSIHSFLGVKKLDDNRAVTTKRKHIRVPRQQGQQEADDYRDNEENDFDEDEDDYETFEQVQAPEEEEDEDEEDYNTVDADANALHEDRVSAETTPSIDTASHHNKTQWGSDDEDLGEVSGSGEEEDVRPTGYVPGAPPPPPPPSHPIYYRISFVVGEPYVDSFSDANSFQFRDFANNVVGEIEKLYTAIPGEQTASVLKIEKRDQDSFTSKVTVDLASVNYNNDKVIRDTLYQQIERFKRLVSITASTDDFQFRAFQGQICQPNEIPCRNGDCVPSEARCNGINECSDGSDEQGCAVQPEVEVEPEAPALPTTTTTPTTEIEPDVGSGDEDRDVVGQTRCRADDAVRCTDGSQTICADQVCDGTADCNDGGDEKDCHECAEGEFICDISRCIPVSKRCDGFPDCSDQTDERECLQCKPDDIKCDNKCVSPSQRCDGQNDCSDGSDEANCPTEAQCGSGQFSCGDYCIYSSQVCDGRPDCRYGEDERNCTTARCRPDQFTCSNPQRCIPISAKCNRIYDCEDQSDERNCPCKPDDFHCKNGFCIPNSQRCDGIHNCQDGSDEEHCDTLGDCASYQWRCRNTKCIPKYLRCNYQDDCGDSSDEQDCHLCHPADEFKCNDGTCISISKRCDGAPDCRSNEDEISCAKCKFDEFKCASGDSCVNEHLRCDNHYDCPDRSDESGCNGETLKCTPNTKLCHDRLKCISNSKFCDGKPDCEDNSDEENCIAPGQYVEGYRCDVTEFECAGGFCIAGYKRCNGLRDCPSGNDEDNCPYTTLPPAHCGEDQVKCEDGTCGNKCDGYFDCLDGSDEANCTICAIDQFTCRNGDCISEQYRCDGYKQCSDGSDESDCVFHCPGGQFRCTHDNLCLISSKRCDGFPDCPDTSDEEGCPRSQNSTCESYQFDCGNGSCIDLSYRCDGTKDCADGRDEQGCPTVCSVDQFECITDRRCIPSTLTCDGNDDCSDGSDEFDCPKENQCLPNEIRCDDGSCIPQIFQCDGTPQCPDGSDEDECPCRPNEFQCLDGQCIPGNSRCDRRNDCRDGSDEHNCPTDAPPSEPEYPTRPPAPLTCPTGYHACLSGDRCILRSQLCDGRGDCPDLSDETNCPGPSEGLNLKTYPNAQDIKENIYKPDREVVFQCRDEGPLRAHVRWTRPNGQPLPPGSRDLNGRLEMPNIKVEHTGTYICEAVGYPPETPGAQVSVHLQVDRWIPPPTRPPTACGLHEATCANGDCIPKNKVCDGTYDCPDGSDESRCNPNGCEPNEFRCANKKCVLKTWRCDSDDDCGDGSDEQGCATNPPGSICAYHQFTCLSNNQCIPKSYHCDLEKDCVDGSDELGCSPPVIAEPPAPMVTLSPGSLFEINCRAVGVPTPEIVWRLNWGHIPAKCHTTSRDGYGTLSCPDIQIEDQGAYSCEAINIKGSTFAVPDTILVVTSSNVCPPGFFNEEARTESECIKCFCFGQSTKCRSADLFIYQFQPPFDTLKLLGVEIDPSTGAVEIRDEPIYRNVQPQLTSVGRSGLHSQLPQYAELSQPNLVPYFAMPENYHGNQLKSYGGFVRFTVRHFNRGYPVPGPSIIISGNGYTLLHDIARPPPPGISENVAARFFEGEWITRRRGYPDMPATREEIMMTLANIDNILIKLQYNEGPLNTTITNIEMDSAAAPNSGLGPASYVEECECPVGYSGTSCEECADGYARHKSGPWLGQCYKQVPETCPAGTYGDPARGRPCEVCPCPLTNPENQFARTCSLSPDGDVTCDCPPGYVGRRCEQCAAGYTGNPLIPGDSCRPGGQCNSVGALSTLADPYGRCQCKDLVDGPTCDHCKPSTFHLHSDNEFGCIACFCMGITRQCTSSDWFRDQISTAFTNSKNEFKLITTEDRERPIEQGISLDQNQREIVYRDFIPSNIYYWSLPPRYLGNKITSYGGYLRYTVRYVPLPGGQSSRNSAADVELVSENQINLLYFAKEQVQPTGSPQTFVVPLLEQYWQRSDGQRADREHLLMALADLSAIYIKATYNTNTRESALISVSLDTASDRNTGNPERALAVEQCHCPAGYKGLSCEDCDVGYTRADEGIYLGLCEPCNCHGNSKECDPETGVCFNCNNFTTGDNCEQCLPGYQGDPVNGIPCRYTGGGGGGGGGGEPCNCDPRGSVSSECIRGICRCKTNVEGINCNRCRPGTFGLTASNIDGCQVCFCSGVARECSESNLYVEQIPSQIIDSERHGFTLTDQYQRQRISNGFQINIEVNEIGYNFPPSTSERWYWSLPREFTGNQVKSYGGRLEFTQRYTQRPQAQYVPDQDVIISGSGITIYWSNPQSLLPEIANKVSVVFNPTSNWQRLDPNQGPRPASREDILTVLANIEAILIRAQQSTDTSSAYLSDITLDTAVEQYTGQSRATDVETCRCPQGYRGTSCESCSSGYYRDIYDYSAGPLGSCSRCPCNNNEQSCNLGPNNRVVCNCLPGYHGRNCEISGDPTPTLPPPSPEPPTPNPPTIDVTIVAPRIEIYEVGSTVRMNCSARSLRGQRPIRVEWSKDGTPLPLHAIDDGRGLLIITNVQVSDSGRYICKADDGWSIVTQDITVTVGTSRPEHPRVVISPPYVDVEEDQPIEIRCAASGNPQPDLRLIRPDGQPLNPTHYFEHGILRIPKAQKTDEAMYQCIATNRVGTDTATVEVTVRQSSEPLLRPEIEPAYWNGMSGENVVLRCRTVQDGVTIQWSRQDGPLPYSSRDDNGMLVIYNARQQDSGTYICTATDYRGRSGSKTARVDISNSDKERQSPVVKVMPEQMTISQGSTAELHCEATGIPVPTIKWTKYGSELPSNIEQRGSVLYIRNAQVSDRGVYVCVSSNEHGLAQAHTTVEVNRMEVPILSIHPQSTQTLVTGNMAYIQCRVDAGIPSPTLKWSRQDGAPLSANIEEMTGGTLKFTQVTQREEGEYVCTAENEAGRATAIANIIIQTPPQVWTIPDKEIVTRKAGEYVKLECHATGNPPPTVEWMKYGRTAYLTPSLVRSEAHLRHTAIEEITRLSHDDEGLYICRGVNDAGVTEKRIQLVIENLPTRGDIVGNRNRLGEDSTGFDGTTENPTYKDNEPYRPQPPVYDERITAPEGERAILRCHVNAADSLAGQISITWTRADNISIPEQAYIKGGTLFIDNVQPESAGEYRCIGTHHGQIVFNLGAYLEVISPPKIELIPKRQVVHPGDNAYIQCSATGQQPITITWTPMGRTMPQSVRTRDGLIQFNNIQLSDAGRYRCTAVNSAGEADAVADVIVEENIHKPTVTAENRQQTAPRGSSVSLRCRAHDPGAANNIRWFRENLPLPESSRVNGEFLHILNLKEDDQGRYYCEISTTAGTSSDYIDLQVSHDQWYCTPTEWQCGNFKCIPKADRCNGYNDCGDNSDEIDCYSRTRRGPIPPQPYLQITPPETDYRVGQSANINCQSSEPGVITTWTKLSGRFADNVQTVGSNLRIYSLRPENGGVYRCEATDRQGGAYYKDLDLNVIDDLKDQPPIETKTAPQGSTIVMECKTGLEEPINYVWSKQGGNLPTYVDIYSRSIQLNEVGSSDAGTYICTASNPQRNMEIPIILVVTGIVPHFTQAPVSYIALPTLPDAYVQLSFEISFKPQMSDGLILYNGNKANDPRGDFISLAINNGVPEFRYYLGQSVTVVRADRPITLNQWHTIKVIRHRKKATMYVDGEGPYIGNADGKYVGLDLSEDLYLGGVPDFNYISPEVNIRKGFVGCISRLKIGYNHHDIMKDSIRKVGTTTCETCSENPCENQGVCQEALSPEGFTCICPSGYSGATCNKLKGEACSPYSCGSGRCIDNDNSFQCLCPLGYAGHRCERQITINEPAFKNNAYIAYPTPKPQRRLKVSLKIKPNDLNDGVLLYCAESDEGHGDFASLAIKDRHLEFRFDVGNGPTIIKSSREIVPGEWLAITASRSLSEGRLIVNGESAIGRSPGNHKALNLLTPLYVGGFDKQNVKINQGVGVDGGFNGCISEINVPGLDLNIIQSVTDSANVEECGAVEDVDNEINPEYAHINEPNLTVPEYDSRKTGCTSSPCQNDGQCYPLSPIDYQCTCLYGYTGKNCEIAPNQCEQLIPCQNGGTCNGNSTSYQCTCPLGYAGKNCENRAQLEGNANFDGNGYLEFDRELLEHKDDEETEVIALELSTNSSNGLIFWHGQTPNEDGQGQDYISLAIVNGYLEYSYDLGSGPVMIRNNMIRVNDGQRHNVILKRTGQEGSIEVDNTEPERGSTPGFTSSLNCNGNIYLGGLPNLELMTGGRFTHGFNGCIHGFEVQNTKRLDLGAKAIAGINVKPCSSSNNDLFRLWDDNDLVN